jgi:hypothetical protein
VENRDEAQDPGMIGLPAQSGGDDPGLIPGKALIKLIFSIHGPRVFIWRALYVLRTER